MDSGIVRFGRVEFDASRGRLSVAGRKVPLDPPCTAILALLVAEAGRHVAKDALLEVGWPGRVVHENSLAKAIGRLRQTLGQDGAALETVHGYGYRLTAEPQSVRRPQGPRFGTRRVAAATATALGLVAAAGLSLAAFGNDEPPPASRGLLRGEPDDALGRVLWVDDNPENNAEERRYLEDRKIAVYQVATTEEALALLAMYDYRVVISDMNRAERPLAGLELVREMRRRGDKTPFVLYTVVPSAAQRTLLAEAGGQRATVDPAELYAAVLPLVGERPEPPGTAS